MFRLVPDYLILRLHRAPSLETALATPIVPTGAISVVNNECMPAEAVHRVGVAWIKMPFEPTIVPPSAEMSFATVIVKLPPLRSVGSASKPESLDHRTATFAGLPPSVSPEACPTTVNPSAETAVGENPSL